MQDQAAVAEAKQAVIDDDGNVVATDAEAIAVMLARGLGQQRKRQEALSKMSKREREAYEHWLLTRELNLAPAQHDSARVHGTGRAPAGSSQ